MRLVFMKRAVAVGRSDEAWWGWWVSWHDECTGATPALIDDATTTTTSSKSLSRKLTYLVDEFCGCEVVWMDIDG